MTDSEAKRKPDEVGSSSAEADGLVDVPSFAGEADSGASVITVSVGAVLDGTASAPPSAEADAVPRLAVVDIVDAELLNGYGFLLGFVIVEI